MATDQPRCAPDENVGAAPSESSMPEPWESVSPSPAPESVTRVKTGKLGASARDRVRDDYSTALYKQFTYRKAAGLPYSREENPMPKGVFVVLSSAATPEQDEALNSWYDDVHLPEVLEVPGIVSARRFKVASAQATDDASLGSDEVYLAIYELDGDFEAVAADVPRRATDGTFTMTDTIRADTPPRAVIYEEI
jgi:hypothetical protein